MKPVRVIKPAVGTRRLDDPRTARVLVDGDGTPTDVDGQPVAHVRESWLIEDRWWTDQPLHRRYWELVSQSGRDIVVFRDLLGGSWFRHR
ncbi:MAG TPA: hypothetical protein VHW26_09985 [Solirubrobacteraceae bacterium]|jgi:hypothetical protein|nr:hypothetical protein [Solirubrobacteraceae bacterium]